MKQETGKKNKKWLWIVLPIVAVLAAAAIAAVFLLPMLTNNGDQGDSVVSEVYWNIDRVKYTENAEMAGLTTREPGEDGLYHIRFACNGQVVDMVSEDKRLVNFIDTMDVMGLVLDDQGMVIDALDVKSIAVETASRFYVKSVQGDMVVLNSSIAMNGMDLMCMMAEDSHIMDVRPGTDTPAQAVVLQPLDLVYVYGTEENPAKSMFFVERMPSSDLYVRTTRNYDAANGITTRIPDADDVYTIEFAHKGELINLKCKDPEVVAEIDLPSDENLVMGLVFDEEGYIIDTISAAIALRGQMLCNYFNITEINGTTVTAERLLPGNNQGKVVTFNLSETTEMYAGETDCIYDFIGQKVDGLQVGDQVVCWSDMNNNALAILLTRHTVDDADMYFNSVSMVSSGVTTRVPDENGYYVFTMAKGGKSVKLKTKDKDLASKIDATSSRVMGLKVEGTIIKEWCDALCVCGGRQIAVNRYVESVTGPIARAVLNTKFDAAVNLMISDFTQVYDVTGNFDVKFGASAKLQQYDVITAYTDVSNNCTYVYITNRYKPGTKLYYNVSRKFDATKQETTRVPDAEGYYTFVVTCDGKRLDVKTKSKELATVIDKQSPQMVALKVSNDIVKAAYSGISAVKYGVVEYNGRTVSKFDEEGKLVAVYPSNGQIMEATKKYKVADNCKVYNLSYVREGDWGEKTKLLIGDKITSIRSAETNEIIFAFVTRRGVSDGLYWHVERMYANGETARVPDADGYYSIKLFTDGKIKTFKTKDKAVMSSVDKMGTTVPFAMKIKGNIILGAYSATTAGDVHGTQVSSYDVTKVSGEVVTVKCNLPGNVNNGLTREIIIPKGCKAYNVDPTSANYLKAVKLKKGDRILAYRDFVRNTNYVFVISENSRGNSYCPHCDKTVWWEVYTGTIYNVDAHYYLNGNRQVNAATLGDSDETIKPFETVLDLNGKTVTSTGRNFLMYNATLTVIDTAGGGIMEAVGHAINGGNILASNDAVINIYGGTLRRTADAPISPAGGNIYLNKNSTLNMYGGSLIGGAAAEGSSIYAARTANLNLSNVTVSGDIIANTTEDAVVIQNSTINGIVDIATKKKIVLGGKTIISGVLDLTSGATAEISGLANGSAINVKAEGIFTEKTEKASNYLTYFKPAYGYKSIQVKDSALWTETDPTVVPVLPGLLQVDNSDLVFAPGTTDALCPVCNKTVTWTPITETATKVSLEASKHYYLPGDLVFAGAEGVDTYIYAQYGDAASCLHLNGHNITATGDSKAIYTGSTLNIMGNGIVSGNQSGVRTSAATIETNAATGVLNLYGGTYIKTAGNTIPLVNIGTAGGEINMFEGAEIDARNRSKDAVRVYYGTFNMYGGTVYGNTSRCINLTSAKAGRSGAANIFGGTLIPGGGPAVLVKGVDGADAKLGLYGGNITGAVDVDAYNQTIIAGNPVVSELNVPTDMKVMLGTLTEGASVKVKANGVFTEALENANAYLQYIKPYESYSPIKVVENALWTKYDPYAIPEMPALLKVDNKDLEFAADTTDALCPVCNKTVTWTPITETTAMVALEAGKHYYLPGDLEFTGTGDKYITAEFANGSACLHLNGHNISVASASKAIYASATLNVMGNGIVTGNGTVGTSAATIETNAANGVLNLYGGTYKKTAGNKVVLANIDIAGGEINLFEGAEIDARGVSKDAVRAYYGTFNMYGGKIYGNTSRCINLTSRTAGKSGAANIFGGTLVPGGGPAVLVKGVDGADAKLGLYGGNITGAVNIDTYNQTVIAGNPVVSELNVSTDMKVMLGTLTEGAEIKVKANGVFTKALENANAYLQYIKPYESYSPIKVVENALWTKYDPYAIPEMPALLKVDNKDLEFAAGTTDALCPVCNKTVTWTPITETTATVSLEADKHYYLPGDLEFTGTGDKYITAEFANGSACLHLNGHNITAAGNARAIYASATLNIMGNGIVSGNFQTATSAATIETNAATGVLNLYGGTYKKADGNKKAPVVNIDINGGVINMFEGATVDARGTNVSKDAVRAYYGTINLYGGTIYANASNTSRCINVASRTAGKSGAANIFGGTLIPGGGPAVLVKGVDGADAKLGLYGGITGAVNIDAYSQTIIAGNPVVSELNVPTDMKVLLGTLTEGAEIKVKANGVFTEPLDDANAYLAYVKAATGYKDVAVVGGALSTEAS